MSVEPAKYHHHQSSVSSVVPPSKGHFRSSSLENNIYTPIKSVTASSSPLTSLQLPGNVAPFSTGTLKSRREQKRLTDIVAQHHRMNSVDDLNSRKSQFRLIRDIFEQNKSTNDPAAPPPIIPDHPPPPETNPASVGDAKPPKIQSCSGVLEQGKQVIRPIAFKPIPYISGEPVNQRFSDLGDRYGSTPSLTPNLGNNLKFGSTSDLRYNCSVGNRKSLHYYNTYDSLESISKSPDSIATSQSTLKTIMPYHHHNNHHHHHHHHQDLLDMTPSPSDSGISELEAALRDRDSELAYLRQTMEHNEKDKEKHWEDEVKRLKIIHESRLRANAQKIQKLEQMLMMQSFQLRQHKKRAAEDADRLNGTINEVRDQNERYRNELCHLKITEKDLKEQNSDLAEEVQILRRMIADFKTRLEETDWAICQKSGETALLKSQLRDAQNDLMAKDQEIAQLRIEIRNQNWEDKNTHKNIQDSAMDTALEVSQLNRIIILKDQVIMAMTNEIQKLRKELSDVSLLQSYEGIPPGRNTMPRFRRDILDFLYAENDTKSGEDRDKCPEKDITKYLSKIEETKRNTLQDYPFLAKVENNPDKGEKKTTIDEMKTIFLNNQIYPYDCKDSVSNLFNMTLNLLQPNPSSSPTIKHKSDEDEVGSETESSKCDKQTDSQSSSPTTTADSSDDRQICDKVKNLQTELEEAKASFDQERLKWAEEKEKVLFYQRQLQLSYMQMIKRTQMLEERLQTGGIADDGSENMPES
ncbi:leucine zipper putative tumor suppressor 1 isoform X2 [Phlebotomus papatasi]|uniref:leucine zipper putative tumor suppressor 1 isoform X2 n=1 Tax=Phlebotomus papatasi TaxID=29031 RepID=UPI002484105B|nr:leucine zipper putative tumor suppressor 1 isoform X2 [Phlebotomus papatasi]